MVTKIKGRDGFSYQGTKPIPKPYPQNIQCRRKEEEFYVGFPKERKRDLKKKKFLSDFFFLLISLYFFLTFSL